MNFRVIRTAAWICICACVALAAPEGKKGRSKGNKEQPSQNSECNNVPAHPFDLVLGRPTRDSVTVSVLAYQDAEGCIAYGTKKGSYLQQTPTRQFKKGEPAEVVIGSLRPDTQYFYQLRARGTNSPEGTFHTQRSRGNSFTFTITADSHLDDRVSAGVYQRTLANALADAPDFHVDLGDTFMTEKHESRENAAKQYLAQRFYFGQLCRSAPLFLVLGNHDGESPRGHGSDADSLAVWSNQMRKRYFPNPVPDGFFTGNATKHPEAGLLQDYYAWEWGDALFVALDPFWFTQKQRGKGDNWKRTLGAEQYQWLKRTLEGSKAKFKFVFIHHLVGGADEQCRGGSEAAPFYEWGGKNADGTDGFKQNRPKWPAPIHQLLVQNRVNIVFHGHDHLYAKQDLDGIVYQEVPQPGNEGGSHVSRFAAEYGYKAGTILGGSGHMRITVSPNKVAADYIACFLSAAQAKDRQNRKIVHSYVIPTAGK
ncbi:MAG: metallophosphoesterase family protein [Verrucomicrobia bacterium]|nr:metallophosphoesterase family protein [Verrucomicrobiota bacterium]